MRAAPSAQAARTGVTRYTLALPALLLGLLCAFVEAFAQRQNLTNVGAQGVGLLVVSLGQLLVALAAGVDLSVGAVVSLTSVLMATAPDAASGAALSLAAGACVGCVNGLGVTRAGIHPLIMTLASMTFVQGLALMLLPIPGGRPPVVLNELATGAWLGVPAWVGWWLLPCVLVWTLVWRTRFGLHLAATGSRPESAALNGVDTRRTTVMAYVLCSELAVLAGAYLSARIGSGDPSLGATLGLESVTAIALGGVQLTGGIGSVTGVVTGALSLGLINNGINLFGVSPFLRGTVTALLLVAAVVVQRRRSVGL